MLYSQSLLSRFPTLSLPLSRHPLSPSPSSSSSSFLRAAAFSGARRFLQPVAALPFLADLPEPAPPPQPIEDDGGGPIEISPPARSFIFSVDDDPSPLQVATSLLLTGAVSIFLFRSLSRRAKRAKELRVRSSGVTKDLKVEALESLKAMAAGPVEAGKPPSPVQALLGGIAAGAIAIILYKFTTTIEASLNRQAIPDNFSVRQITITIRTIVNGICYLATFVFGINSIGLTLYALQLAFGSLKEDVSNKTATSEEIDGQVNTMPPAESSVESLDDVQGR